MARRGGRSNVTSASRPRRDLTENADHRDAGRERVNTPSQGTKWPTIPQFTNNFPPTDQGSLRRGVEAVIGSDSDQEQHH
jgi:hypothetical protein